MNTSRSRRKLAEAAFFLAKLEETHCQFPDFNYYLSAYFSAARSVSWILKAEYGKKDGFAAWYDAFNASAEDEEFMRIINSIRVRTEKHEPVDAVPTLISGIPVHPSVPEAELVRESQSRGQRTISHKTSAGFTMVTSQPVETADGELHGIERRLPEFPDYDVTVACRKYFMLIERLLSECECKHAA
jgi:hypothetical protein